MTALEYEGIPEIGQEKTGFFAALSQFLAKRKRRRAERLMMIEFSRFDAYLLRDIGINPSDLPEALRGRFSAVLLDPKRRNDWE